MIKTLALKLMELKATKKELDEQIKSVNEEIKKVEKELAEEMVNMEMQSFTHDGYLFYLTTKVYASPISERKAELYTWLKEHGYGDLVQETVNTNTFTAFIRELIEQEELPHELRQLINIYEETTIGMRRKN